jgi:hypothetical protein
METSMEIAAPAGDAWEVLTDTERWTEWGLSITEVECGQRYIAQGTSGWVKTVFGLWLPFRIDTFEEGKNWSWSVAGIKATGHRVESIGPDKCRVIFSVPLFVAPYLVVCKLALIRIKRILVK